MKKLSPVTIDVVKNHGDTENLPAEDAQIIEFGRQLFRDKKVAPEIFAALLERFGRQGMVDLVSLMANYAATALLLAAFDMQLPPGQEPLLP